MIFISNINLPPRCIVNKVPDATSRTTPWTFRLPDDLREVYEALCRAVNGAITSASEEGEARVHIEIFQKVELTAK
ncbi:MAG: hypothetical protein IPI24_04200 [Ignavibacteria bacterium]|nr:hypothetical protein [Ignavibacteria bacterium]